ncbi:MULTISPECIES: Hachiman antiphage defense system protein HamA [Thermotaleaceae]|uniref:Anti-bacteriophage protein A/HamA C-terminal domain-containing protein n=1 Tax=Geosporobacter subterraneus DSM 17957 TaxID=1121919 RepID=A0A1M6HTR4_9FIRM|nr:Hachiman antiphage defense system protein HamA [Geosporobacter subterraneus]SHJ25498.1 protein of unknown function [Geosporobacter subterraneus DSM 17957]
MAGIKIVKECFKCFNIYSYKDNYSFIHVEIQDAYGFYEGLFRFFFNEDSLLRYAEHKANIKFTPGIINYATLFKHLRTYIDDINIEKDISELEEAIVDLLKKEMSCVEKDGKIYVRLDKIGKIGEYMFCCLLSEYFHFDCIIPKVHLQTDTNMSVYGIDTLFYSEKENLLLFGESKVSISLSNGIQLIKKSLSDYEKQLSEEYRLVLSNRLYKDKLYKFTELFGEAVETTTTIQKFIDKAGITQIGIPIFIAHGTEVDNKKILDKLSKVSSFKMFGIKTCLIGISLPIINKTKMITIFTKMIKEMEDYYENEANR